MRPRSSPSDTLPPVSELFDPILGATAVGAATDDRAWLGALCEVETALARACARAGLIELSTALEVGAAADEISRSNPADLGRAAVAGGNPVIPLVERLLPPQKRVGVLTFSAALLGPDHLAAAGAAPDTPIVGAERGREFWRVIAHG